MARLHHHDDLFKRAVAGSFADAIYGAFDLARTGFHCRQRVGDGKAEIADIVGWRRANQPGGSNAGSVFTNPAGSSAGEMVDAAGLKGLRIGTAEVSAKHANFIQADEGGSADDVRRLIGRVRQVVEDSTGVRLATEVRMVGFDDEESEMGA